MAFHWPRLDKDLLLCVRNVDVRNCMWSGGIRLDDNYSLTINIRDSTGKMYFLRVDVVLQESTYFIVFTDADTMPPPIRVDNFSEVPLVVNQVINQDILYQTRFKHRCHKLYHLTELIRNYFQEYFCRLPCTTTCNGQSDHTPLSHMHWTNPYRLLL